MGNDALCCSTKNDLDSSEMVKPSSKKECQCIEKVKYNGCEISIDIGDIFMEDVDAIAIPSNPKLKLQSGLSDQIKKLGGQDVLIQLQQNLLQLGGKAEIGQCIYTKAGNLNFEFIFYAVLPNSGEASVIIYSESQEEKLNSASELNDMFYINEKKKADAAGTQEKEAVYNVIYNCLKTANSLGLKSIAFSVMESSIYIQRDKIAQIMIFAIKSFLNEQQSLTKIKITSNPSPGVSTYSRILKLFLSDENGEFTLDQLIEYGDYISNQQYALNSQSDLRVKNFCNGYTQNHSSQVKNSF